MRAVQIPDLRRKYDLLRTYSTLKTREQLAAAFDREWKTLEWWARGDSGRDPNLMPPAAVETLTALIREMLPAATPAGTVRQLLLGPAALLERRIRSGNLPSLADLLAAEADTRSARLILRPDDLSLVEYGDERRADHPRVAAGAYFRIEFRLPSARPHAVALQHVQQLWAVLDLSVSADGMTIHVPGYGAAGELDDMRERRDLGLHQFVCLAGPRLFPADLDAHRREGTTLGKPDLDGLAAFFGDLPRAQRVCQLLTVSIEAGPEP